MRCRIPGQWRHSKLRLLLPVLMPCLIPITVRKKFAPPKPVRSTKVAVKAEIGSKQSNPPRVNFRGRRIADFCLVFFNRWGLYLFRFRYRLGSEVFYEESQRHSG